MDQSRSFKLDSVIISFKLAKVGITININGVNLQELSGNSAKENTQVFAVGFIDVLNDSFLPLSHHLFIARIEAIN